MLRDRLWSLLGVAERVTITIAACVALFPLWQWWVEREARQMDRLANAATAASLCQLHREQFIENNGPLPEKFWQLLDAVKSNGNEEETQAMRDKLYTYAIDDLNLRSVCHDADRAMANLTEGRIDELISEEMKETTRKIWKIE